MKGKHIFSRLRDRISLQFKRVLLFPYYLDYRQWEREKKVSFLINICLGIILGVAFLPLLRLQLMENIFNSTMDKMIRKETAAFMKIPECRIPSPSLDPAECARLDKRLSKDIVFIDIDNSAYTGWGEPLFIPRNEIARFLKLADKNEARVVALDILFDYPSYNPGEDAELRSVLKDLTNRQSGLRIIFPTIKSSIDNKIRKNIFDDLIDNNPNFYRGFPYESFSKSDRVVRYIRYYDIAKGRDGRNMVLWTVPVLSAALFTNDFSRLKALEPKILGDSEHHRTEKYRIELSNKNKTPLEIGNNELFSNRIRFALIPPGTLAKYGNLYPRQLFPGDIDTLQQTLKDKVVIIGTSSRDKEELASNAGGRYARYVHYRQCNERVIGELADSRDAAMGCFFSEHSSYPLCVLYVRALPSICSQDGCHDFWRSLVDTANKLFLYEIRDCYKRNVSLYESGCSYNGHGVVQNSQKYKKNSLRDTIKDHLSLLVMAHTIDYMIGIRDISSIVLFCNGRNICPSTLQ